MKPLTNAHRPCQNQESASCSCIPVAFAFRSNLGRPTLGPACLVLECDDPILVLVVFLRRLWQRFHRKEQSFPDSVEQRLLANDIVWRILVDPILNCQRRPRQSQLRCCASAGAQKWKTLRTSQEIYSNHLMPVNHGGHKSRANNNSIQLHSHKSRDSNRDCPSSNG